VLAYLKLKMTEGPRAFEQSGLKDSIGAAAEYDDLSLQHIGIGGCVI